MVFNISKEIMPADLQLIDEWLRLLQESGYRQTLARRTIVEVILNSPRALEPIEVFNKGRNLHAKLGLVTVYRTLEKLEELSLVQRVHQPGGCNMYLRATHGHEHLIICTRCGKADFFSGDDLSPLMNNVTNRTGFTINNHWLQLFGLCPECKNQ